MSEMIPEVTTEFLQAFADACNRHDVDALMSFMTEECVFESSMGPDVCGTRYVHLPRRHDRSERLLPQEPAPMIAAVR